MTRPLRVLFLEPTALVSGGGTALLRLVTGLDRRAFRVLVVLGSDGPLVARFRAIQGCRVLTLPLPPAMTRVTRTNIITGGLRAAAAAARYGLRLRRLAERWHADIVHSNGFKMHVLSSLSVAVGRHLVWHVRDYVAPPYMPSRSAFILRQLVHRVPDVVICNSVATLQSLGRHPGAVVIAGGVSLEAARAGIYTVPDGVASAVSLAPKGAVSPRPRVLMLGRIAAWKGQDVFVRAARRLCDNGLEAEFLIAGASTTAKDEAYEADLRQMIESFDLSGRVRMLGLVADVPALLRRGDIVAHCSTTPEPFGQVLIEAMAAGVPVVASDAGGPREVIRDGVDGRLYPPGDDDALASVLRELLDNAPLRKRLAAAARQTVADRFTIERTVERITAIYRQLGGATSVLHAGKFYPPTRGGMETILQDLCEQTATTWAVRAVVASEGARTVRETRNGVDVVRVGSLARVASVPLAPKLPLELWRQRADCVVLHEPNPLAGAALFLRMPARRLVVWHHSDLVRPWWARFVYGWVQRRLYRRAACVIVSSPALRDQSPVVRHARRIEVVPFGIALERFLQADAAGSTRARALRSRYWGPLALFVGRLVYYKGVEVLLRAFSQCAGTLLIVGDGPLRRDLRDLAGQLDLGGRVHFVGALDPGALLDHYRAADVFVLPSTHPTEAFGLAQVEAMACGLPVVSTDLPTGVPWVNQHEVTGLIVPPGDTTALAAAIDRLLEDPALRVKMGEAGRQRAIAEFSRERMVERFRQLIEDVMRG